MRSGMALEEERGSVWRILPAMAWVLAGLALFLAAWQPVGIPDVWWQLAEGEAMWRGDLSPVPVQGFGESAGRMWSEYLVVAGAVAGAWRVAGVEGVRWFYVLLMVVPVMMLWDIGRSQAGRSVRMGLLVGTGLVLLMMRVQPRPEMVGMVCLLVLGWLLAGVGRRVDGRVAVAAGLVGMCWANSHGGFVMGVVVIGLWGMERWVRAGGSWKVMGEVAMVGGAFVLGVLVNPEGVGRWALPWELWTSRGARVTTNEMWPMAPAWLPCLLVPMGLMALVPVRLWRGRWWMGAFFLVILLMGARSYRFVYFAWIPMWWMAWVWSREAERMEPRWDAGRVVCWWAGVVMAGVLCWLLWVNGVKTGPVDWARLGGEGMKAVAEGGEPWSSQVVLCHATPGSLASWPPGQRVVPMIHSGKNRFSEATLNYYAMVDMTAEARAYALEVLEVDAVLLTWHNLHWARSLVGHAAWRPVASGKDWILLRRGMDAEAEAAVRLVEAAGQGEHRSGLSALVREGPGPWGDMEWFRQETARMNERIRAWRR